MVILKVFITIGLTVIFVGVMPQDIYETVWDHHSTREKGKMVMLCAELIAESKYKIHQTDALRDSMSNKLGFQIGVIMGKIREKYRSMLEMYRQMSNKFSGKSKIAMPYHNHRRAIYYIWKLEFILAQEQDINRLIHILEQIDLQQVEDYHEEREEQKPRLRVGGRSEEFEALLARKEEEVKEGYRQQYMMEKLGLPQGGSTSG